MQDQQAQPAGLRLQHLKLVVVVPLTVLGIALGVVLLQRSGDLTALTPGASLGLELPTPLAMAEVSEKSEKVESTNSTKHRPTMKEIMQSKVKDCARTITGDDTPRKLDPEIRKKVLDCASDVMPAMDTGALLKASADQLRAAAKDSGDTADAEKVIASVADHEALKGAQPAGAKSVHAGR